jgi:hypothetical protein
MNKENNMIEKLTQWMFQPGTYNDMIVYLALFLVTVVIFLYATEN